MNAPVHHPSVFWPSDERGELLIAGWPLTRIAERVGSDAFYAYDATRLEQRVQALRAAIGPHIRLKYAIKANPFPPLVAALARRVDGLDVASEGEMALALDVGMNPAAIAFAAPGKRAAALRRAIAAGCTITIESAAQLRASLAIAEALGVTPRLALRINPDFAPGRAGMVMGGGPQPFGVDREAAPVLLREILACGAEWVGLHLYAGSQLRDAAQLSALLRAAHKTLVAIAQSVGTWPAWFNLGGGFGIPYFPGEAPLDLAAVGETLQQLAEQQRTLHDGTPLVIELGRYLVGEAGIFAAQVLERKVSRGRTYLVVAAGLNAHLSASGNFGQVLRKNYPCAIGNRLHEPASETVHVVGPLCTPLDRLAEAVALPPAQPGDWFVVFQSGAYGASASPQRFLSHPTPAECLVWPDLPAAATTSRPVKE